MPTSYHEQISQIVEIICDVDPRRLLDVGIGFGKYGFLAREYLEARDAEIPYGTRNRIIDGVEVFPQYVTQLQRQVYDTIHIGDAIDVVATLPCRYDLALLVDVIEHMEYTDGLRLVRDLKARADAVLISTPKDMPAQGPIHGNSHMRHRTQWRKDQFVAWSPIVQIPNPHCLMLLIADDQLRRKILVARLMRRVSLAASAASAARSTV